MARQELISEPKLKKWKKGRKAFLAISVTNINDFVTIGEQLPPEKLWVVMKMFHEKMGRIINEHKGYINDIVADNILATWGILDEKGNSADMAIQSAIHQLMEMSEFNRELETHGLPRLEIRIGIHSAELVIGDMGEGHLSAMGDGVNLAIRVCSLAKNLKTNLLITEFAQKQSKRRDFIKVVEFKSISHRRDINLYQLSQHE